jgi:uncharacterized membrane protein YkgB
LSFDESRHGTLGAKPAIPLEKSDMYNVFYIIGVIVVVLAILSLIGLT